MTCPRCLTSIPEGLTCVACRMAWPDASHIDPHTPQYRAAAKRWHSWTLDKQRAAYAARERSLIDG